MKIYLQNVGRDNHEIFSLSYVVVQKCICDRVSENRVHDLYTDKVDTIFSNALY